jgi:hypothetical protein
LMQMIENIAPHSLAIDLYLAEENHDKLDHPSNLRSAEPASPVVVGEN